MAPAYVEASYGGADTDLGKRRLHTHAAMVVASGSGTDRRLPQLVSAIKERVCGRWVVGNLAACTQLVGTWQRNQRVATPLSGGLRSRYPLPKKQKLFLQILFFGICLENVFFF